MLKGGREGVSGEREGGTECVTEMREEGRDGVRKEWVDGQGRILIIRAIIIRY